MAFKDIEVILYDGSIKLKYTDKTHRYFAKERISYELPREDPKAWGTLPFPAGTTTLIGETLEKKGLMSWPMGLALGELFGFYNFTNDEGDKMTGFSKGKGTLWGSVQITDGQRASEAANVTRSLEQEDLLPIVKSASEAWSRKKKKGADIGSCVHSAIEHFITGKEFDVREQYTISVMNADYESPADQQKAIDSIEEDVGQAELALQQFKNWWTTTKPELIATEALVYSKEHNVSGTFDGLLKIDGKLVVADWKTSNASKSKDAAAPQGVYYDYFIQSAIYAMALIEMKAVDQIDDLLIVSCRKDGGFDTKFASEVGLTMDDLYNWAKAVITCYKLRAKTRKALLKGATDES